ncbi:MAG: hypothetical protein H6974_12330 [Gammaproteobacteria bacterium]|nr:hypothetical protein [Gammaproteobacteria bacterium]
MPDTTVKYFDSTMPGAPSLSGTAGALIGILTACLKDGFGSVTVDSLVVASDLATATVSGGHGLAMIGHVGPVIRISGASPGGLNADVRVTVTSATQFTFSTSGIADQTATGTISAKRAPAGWSIAHSDTNKAAFKADSVEATGLLLRVDDTGTTAARVRGYESMTDVDNGSGLFPTDAQFSGGYYAVKSSVASSATRLWRLYADHRAFYLAVDNYGTNGWLGLMFFGDLLSDVPGDAYGCKLVAGNTALNGYMIETLNNASSIYGVLARGYAQTGGSVYCSRVAHAKNNNVLGGGGSAYPNPVDHSVLAERVQVWDADTALRGLMPGLFSPVHSGNPPDGTVISDWAGLEDRTLITQAIANSYRCLIDLTGPWR